MNEKNYCVQPIAIKRAPQIQRSGCLHRVDLPYISTGAGGEQVSSRWDDLQLGLFCKKDKSQSVIRPGNVVLCGWLVPWGQIILISANLSWDKDQEVGEAASSIVSRFRQKGEGLVFLALSQVNKAANLMSCESHEKEWTLSCNLNHTGKSSSLW